MKFLIPCLGLICLQSFAMEIHVSPDGPIKTIEAARDTIVEHCTFDYMKEHADLTAPLGGAVWEGGGKTFINKGTNGRWKDTLTPEDVARYEEVALERLGPECAHWVATGEVLNS